MVELSIEQPAEHSRKRARDRTRRERYFAQRHLVNGRLVAPVPEDQHGRRNTYSYYGCRCELCCMAARQWLRSEAQQERRRVSRAVRAARRVLVDGRPIAPVPTEQHGLANTYSYHLCRCETCTRAQNDRSRRYHTGPDMAEKRARATQADRALRRRNYARRQYIDGRWIALVPPERHGRHNTYVRYGCRCEACKAVAQKTVRASQAIRQSCRERRMARRVLIDGRLVAPLPPEKHGKASTYNNHWCRCVECVAAHSDKLRVDRTRRRGARTAEGR